MKVTQYCHIIYKSSIRPCDFIVCLVYSMNIIPKYNSQGILLQVLAYMTLIVIY